MDTATRRARRRELWRARAEKVRDAFGLVFLLVILTYVLASLLDNRGWGSVVITAASGATSVIALTSSHVKPRFVHIAIWSSGLTIVLASIGAASGAHLWLNFASLIQILLLTVAMAAVLRRVVNSDNVSSRTILGAISVYVLLGILFTYVYLAVDKLQPGHFFGQPTHTGDFIFFSVTTLSTTGYGNLVPAGQPGKMLSGLEMLVGQIFLVTLIAGLVSLWRPGLLSRRP